MSSQTALRLSAAIPLLALTACAVGPDYHRPSVETPPAFKEAQGWTPAQPADGVSQGDWWSMFNDPTLNALEQKVAITNQNVAAAAAAYDEARAVVAEQRAALFPTVDLTGAATRSGSGGGHAASSGQVVGGQVVSGQGVTNDFQASLGATWAPDIWGQIRREIENAKGLAQASEAQLADATLSAQSEVAADYVQLRVADAQEALLKATVDAYARSLQIVENQFAAGMADASDVATAKSTLSATQASLVDLGSQRAADEHAIAMLTGQPPADLTIAPDPNWAPQVPETPITVPSLLLQRRPDVAAAERQAMAANAEIGVAVAAYFPTLDLSASGGYASTALSRLFQSSSSLWSLGANVSETVFNGFLTQARVRAAKAAYAEAVANYREAALTAFQQVEDNLAAAHVLQDEEPLRADAASQADIAEKVALNEYQAGTVAYTSVVVAQASALSARQTLVTLQGERMTTAISLVEALGGGWSGKL